MKVIPKNEAELIFRFAQEMPGVWELLSLQTSSFPDAILKIRGKKTYKVEFEFESKSFLRHKHKVEECDLIICWIHDWDDCPLPVLELSNPDWLKTRIPNKLSREEAISWETSQIEDPVSEMQRAQERIIKALHAQKNAQARINTAHKDMTRISRTWKRNKSEKANLLYSPEEKAKIMALIEMNKTMTKNQTITGPLQAGALVTHQDYPDFRGRIMECGLIKVLDGWRGPTMPKGGVVIPKHKLVSLRDFVENEEKEAHVD